MVIGELVAKVVVMLGLQHVGQWFRRLKFRIGWPAGNG